MFSSDSRRADAVRSEEIRDRGKSNNKYQPGAPSLPDEWEVEVVVREGEANVCELYGALDAENEQVLRGEPPFFFSWMEVDLIPSEASWHLIVSYPPYIPSAEISSRSREVRHDPVLALDGGADGLEIYRRLIPSAQDSPHQGGSLFLEIGTGQEQSLIHLGRETGYQHIELRKDRHAIPRTLHSRK